MMIARNDPLAHAPGPASPHQGTVEAVSMVDDEAVAITFRYPDGSNTEIIRVGDSCQRTPTVPMNEEGIANDALSAAHSTLVTVRLVLLTGLGLIALWVLDLWFGWELFSR